MAESACLRRSLSHPSDAFRQPADQQGDPIRALTDSVSFGRFVSESLAWEKWSAFSHNRYLEEVEQLSKAGSVAEKKAFFEEHYKRRAAMKAAALLEQANAKAESNPEPGPAGRSCSVSLASSQLAETVNVAVPDAQLDHSADAKCVPEIGQCDQVGGRETGVGGSVNVEQSVHLKDQVQVVNAESCDDNVIATPKGVADEVSGKKENVALRAYKRLMNPARPPNTNKAPKDPKASVKQESFSATKASSPWSGSTSASVISKKNSSSKSVHMSISFSPSSGEKNGISPRKSKVNSPTSWNPTRAFVHGFDPGTSKPEEYKRQNLTVNKSISGRNITGGISQTVASCSRSSISDGSKAKHVTVSSPFRFRSEERAAKRREKLEGKSNASKAEIHHEGQQRYKLEKPQQGTNSGSRLDEAPRLESKLRTQTTRMSVVTPQLPKSRRKPPSSESMQERRIRPPQRTLKKSNQSLSLSVASSPLRGRGRENASPNIQR